MRSIIGRLTVLSFLISAAVPAGALDGFIENRGLLSDEVLYYAPGNRISVFCTRTGLVLDLHETTAGHRMEDVSPPDGRIGDRNLSRRGYAVWIHFVDASLPIEPQARGELAAHTNYLLGNDPSGWFTDVPSHAEIVYRDLWPGVDLLLTNAAGRFGFELTATSGGDPARAAFRYEGADEVEYHADGSALLKTSVGSFHVFARSTSAEPRGSVVSSSSPRGRPYPDYDKDNPDALIWSTYLGGSDWDGLDGALVSLDGDGNVLVSGGTRSPDFPTSPGAYDESYGGGVQDLFVSKLSASGSDLLWSTFLGGNDEEWGATVLVDDADRPIIVGRTRSSDFPTTPGAFQEDFLGGFDDAFVTKLTADGSDLEFSTFLAGSDYEETLGLALDSDQNLVVVGSTSSDDFPVTAGAYDESCGNCTTGQDGFVAKLNASGTDLIWSTFIGGGDTDLPGRDFCFSAALDSAENVVVVGRTEAQDFPTTAGAFQENISGDEYDAFVSKLDESGSTLLWSSFLGGQGDEVLGLHDAVAVDPSGNPVVAGSTTSSDFPVTAGAFDETFEGSRDAFVTKFNSSGTDVVWSTFLGGDEYEHIYSMKLDSAGNIVVTGETGSCDYPVTPGAYDDNNQPVDAFVTSISPSGSSLVWSTFLGGGSSDVGQGLSLDAADNPVIGGRTASTDFPTTSGAYDETFNEGGIFDCFVSKLDGAAMVAMAGGHGPWVDGGELRGGCPPSDVPDASGRPTEMLLQNTPNPFGLGTVISYELPRGSRVTLQVHDVTGRVVRTLVARGDVDAGFHRVPWDGRDDRGRDVASGIYMYRLRAGDLQETRRLVIVR